MIIGVFSDFRSVGVVLYMFLSRMSVLCDCRSVF